MVVISINQWFLIHHLSNKSCMGFYYIGVSIQKMKSPVVWMKRIVLMAQMCEFEWPFLRISWKNVVGLISKLDSLWMKFTELIAILKFDFESTFRHLSCFSVLQDELDTPLRQIQPYKLIGIVPGCSTISTWFFAVAWSTNECLCWQLYNWECSHQF